MSDATTQAFSRLLSLSDQALRDQRRASPTGAPGHRFIPVLELWEVLLILLSAIESFSWGHTSQGAEISQSTVSCLNSLTADSKSVTKWLLQAVVEFGDVTQQQ